MAWRISEERQTGLRIRGCGIRRGLQVTFGGGGTLGAAFGGSVWRGVEMEGACSSVGDCWKGLGIGSPLKRLRNWEVVGVWEIMKVSEIGVGRTLRQLQSGKQVIPWQRAQLSQQTLSLTTRTWNTSLQQNCSHDTKPNGPNSCLNSTSSYVSVPESSARSWML